MKKLVLWLVLWFAVLSSLGQSVDLRFQKFDFNNSLSAYVVTDLEQDGTGFIWLATNNGLFRFDGKELLPYLNPEGKDFGINERTIMQLHHDANGKLWIAMNAHLAYYDLASDSIITVADELQTGELQSPMVSGIAGDQQQNLYVSQGNAIYIYLPDEKQFKLYCDLQGQEIADFFFDANNQLWIAGHHNVYLYDPLNQRLNEQIVHRQLPREARLVDIQLFSGNLWMLTLEHGVFALQLSEQTIKQYEYQPGGYNYAREMYLDKENNLWLITFSGLKLYHSELDIFQGYYPLKDDEYAIKPNVSRVFQDRDLNYWTLHIPGGIGFSPKITTISRFNSKVNSPFRLSADNVTAVCEDQYGNLWMGNAFNGIDVFEWAKGRTVTYKNEEGNPKSLGKGAILEIFRDSRQQMWIGSYWGGLQRFRPETGDFESHVFREGVNSISGNDVRSVAEDQDGNLWVCVHGKGVDCFDPVKGTWRNFNNANAGLANDFTFEIVFDPAGTAWVATAWGLSSLAKGDTIFRSYLHNNDNENSISANLVVAVYVDKNNRLWAGTSNGLNVYLPEIDGFRFYNAGFKNKQVVSITGDDALNIWCGTSNGISRLNSETGTVLNLGRDHGLISDVFEARSVYNNEQGTLFFGTKDGINYFNTADFSHTKGAPKVVLTRLKIFDHEAVIGKDIDSNIVLAKKLTLPYNYKIFTLNFAALDYLATEKHQFAYMLEGFDKEWNYTENQHAVSYTNLKHGEYTFKVKASSREGAWDEAFTQLQIVVKPPFWSLWYFHLLLTVMLALLMYWIVISREKSLRKTNDQLEQKVLERTIDINLQNEQLEKQKFELIKAGQVKDRFFSILAHDLRSPVYSLIQLTDLLKQKIIDGEVSTFQPIVEKVAVSAENTRNLLDDLLLWGNAQQKQIELDQMIISAETLVMQSVSVYKPIAEEKKIRLEVSITVQANVKVDVNSMQVVLRNLLSNAIKFSHPKSVIEVKLGVKNNEQRITVTDYGVGMSKDQLAHLFDYGSKQSTKGTAGEHGTGLGIILAKELTEQNGGRLNVKSRKEFGTKFTITLPLAEAGKLNDTQSQ